MSGWMAYFQRGRSRYAPLPTNDAPDGHVTEPATAPGPADPTQADPNHRTRRALRATAVGLMLVMLGAVVVAFSRSPPRQCDTPDRGFQCGTALSHSWGQYSPYFSVPSEVNPAIPKGCELTFVQVLSRHGARAPTLGRAVYYAGLIDRIHNQTVSYSPSFNFLKTYEYALGADQLTEMGQQQMVNSGRKFYHRYHALTSKSAPFVRTAGQDRVVQSAENFTQGFHSALLLDRKATARPTLPYPMLVIPETPTTNNTLHHGLCTAFEESTTGSAAQAAYLSTFAPPITARLNTNLPGANLTDADTLALMDLCPFETVASPSGATLAPFCHLFSGAEWRAYDYYQSLGKWYGYGPGHALGPTQGVGFVNELLARLTRRAVRDGTSTNRTLDADPASFPLYRSVYADFSHDNDMMGVLGALGVYDGVAGLSNATRQAPEEVGGFAASWAVPFAARVYVEKMRCRMHSSEELVRVLVNDRVVRMKGCRADNWGFCTLGRFVESMEFAREDGRWDMCFDTREH